MNECNVLLVLKCVFVGHAPGAALPIFPRRCSAADDCFSGFAGKAAVFGGRPAAILATAVHAFVSWESGRENNSSEDRGSKSR